MKKLTFTTMHSNNRGQATRPAHLILALLSSLCIFSEASASILAPQDLVPLTYDVKQANADEFADRSAPEKVPPVVHGNVEFVVIHFASNNGAKQNGGYIEARDKSTGKKLWGVQVYTTNYDKDLEQDVQDVFITEMKLDPKNNVLLVKDEENRAYTINIETRQVTLLKKE